MERGRIVRVFAFYIRVGNGDPEPVRSPRPWDTSIFGVVFPVETLKNITSRFSEGKRKG